MTDNRWAALMREYEERERQRLDDYMLRNYK